MRFKWKLFSSFFIATVPIGAMAQVALNPTQGVLRNQFTTNSSAQNSVGFSEQIRDPFAITPQMIDNENFQVKRPVEFVPLTGNIKLPKMNLRGVITNNDSNQALTALLEIEGLGVFVVREGDTVGLSTFGNGQDVILIESINRLSLVIRTGSYGGVSDQRFVVR